MRGEQTDKCAGIAVCFNVTEQLRNDTAAKPLALIFRQYGYILNVEIHIAITDDSPHSDGRSLMTHDQFV
ncbi:hypothetical protein D3C71_1997840 [compost metagenome]